MTKKPAQIYQIKITLDGAHPPIWRHILAPGNNTLLKLHDILLEKLKQLSEFQDTRDVFQARLQKLAQKYNSRPSLIGRWKQHDWVKIPGDIEHANCLQQPQRSHILFVPGDD
jgi:hypothetical protein